MATRTPNDVDAPTLSPSPDPEPRDPNDAAAAPRSRRPAPRPDALLQVRDPSRYDVLGEHGRGGLGKVARAHDKELGRDVAIKELIKRSDVGEFRFLREAMITARLEHPSIVPIYEAGRWPDGTPFYVMKLIAGRSLSQLLAERRTVDQRITLLDHVVAVADAVAYAHQRKIIHRDLKPGNVVIGDFGETVVIDWGLAKDLSEPDEPTLEPAAYRAADLADLTETGAVLGTPTYMPPEQFRGEPVDARADVFAIGAMLWELCSTSKVPPEDPRHRDRLLRKAGIDADLGAIIGKALSPEPARRYRDAGELAADLEAFTSGARIASRRYSALGVIRHWIRRHRAWAIAITATLAVATIGTVIAVVNIATARDRAEHEQGRAERAAADLTLENAELLMTRDPTAALAALAGYRGGDTLRKQRLLAEARGRGVAEAVFRPHQAQIHFLYGDESGAIFSVGRDGKIVVTRDGVSTTLVSDVHDASMGSESPRHHTLAYINDKRKLALLNLKTSAVSTVDVEDVVGFTRSLDGTRLAVVNSHNELTIWALVPKVQLLYRRILAGELRPTGTQQKNQFGGVNRLLTVDEEGLRVISLDGTADVVTSRRPVRFDTREDGTAIAGYADGNVAVLARDLTSIAEISVCKEQLARIEFVPGSDAFVGACKEGVVSVFRFDPEKRAITVDKSFVTNAPIDDLLAVDHAGRWIVAGDMSSTVYVYDLATRIVTRLEGHAGVPVVIAAPTPGFDRILVGDYSGIVRVWRPPVRDARVVYQAPACIEQLAISLDDRDVVVASQEVALRSIRLADGRVAELGRHFDWPYDVRAAANGMVTTSTDGTIRTWDTKLRRVFRGHTNRAISGVGIHPSGQVISTGLDGRLFAWSFAGDEQTLLLAHSKALWDPAILRGSGNIIVTDTARIWEVTLAGKARDLQPPQGRTRMLRASRDGRLLAVGTFSGDVHVYDTATWTVRQTANLGEPATQVVFDPQARDLIVVLQHGVRAIPLDARRKLAWTEFPLRARERTSYHPSGDVVAFPSVDGAVWFYSVVDDNWIYTRGHEGDVVAGEFTHDGKSYVSADFRGAVIVRDVAATLAAARQRPAVRAP